MLIKPFKHGANAHPSASASQKENLPRRQPKTTAAAELAPVARTLSVMGYLKIPNRFLNGPIS